MTRIPDADDTSEPEEDLVEVDFAEAVAPTLEQAIVSALDILGADEDEVEIEVLEQGKRGFLGLARGKPFRVRVSWREDLDEEVIEEEIGEGELEEEESWEEDTTPDLELSPREESTRQLFGRHDVDDRIQQDPPLRSLSQPLRQPELAQPVAPPITIARGDSDPTMPPRRSYAEATDPPSTSESERAREATEWLLDEMGFDADVNVDWQDEEVVIQIECEEGDDALLIGRRGDTRAALQHIVQRLLGPGHDRAAPLLLDVNGYWGRRAEKLALEAQSLAGRAHELGREFQTEPLPAQERRVVHRALLGDDRVATESVGSGPLKKVAIIPRRSESAE